MYAAPPRSVPANALLPSARLRLRPYQPADVASFFQLIAHNRERLRPSFPAREAAVQTPADAARVLTDFAHDWQTGRLYVLGI